MRLALLLSESMITDQSTIAWLAITASRLNGMMEETVAQRRMGGFTAVAAELTTARGKQVTRQGVYMWWKRRDRNEFPDRHPVTKKNGDGTRLLFDVEEVTEWYDWYMSRSWQGRRD